MSVLTPTAQPRASDRPEPRSLLHTFLARPEAGSLAGAVMVFVFFYVTASPFRDASSLATVLYQSSVLGIPAVAVALLMIGGEFDLSAGVGVVTSSLTASMVAYQLTANVWVGVTAALVLSLAIGAFNGVLLMRTGLPSFLITLATFLMLQGLNLAVTKLVSGGVATDDISDMDGFESARAIFASEFTVGGASVKVTVLYWILFVVLATWVLLRTKVGNWIFAIGGQAASARAVGVPVRRTKIGLFMTVGLACWFLGMHQLFAFNTVQSGEGIGNELLYIAAAVVGGCLLTGGYGTAVGPAIGAFIFGMTTQGIVYAGWDPNWFMFFVGATLLLATLLNNWVRQYASRR
jgi:simple sugar transport system permease protein